MTSRSWLHSVLFILVLFSGPKILNHRKALVNHNHLYGVRQGFNKRVNLETIHAFLDSNVQPCNAWLQVLWLVCQSNRI